MNQDNDQERDTTKPEPPFSVRLAQKLEAVFRPELLQLGLELQAVMVDDVPDDDIVAVLIGTEISIHVKVKASYCSP